MAVVPVLDRQSDPSFQPASAGGDSFMNDGATELLILNTGITAVVVTAVAARPCNQGFLDSWTQTAEPGEVLPFGPFKPSRFNDATGQVSVTYADASDLSVTAKRQI